jgi:hypothetical protein
VGVEEKDGEEERDEKEVEGKYDRRRKKMKKVEEEEIWRGKIANLLGRVWN